MPVGAPAAAPQAYLDFCSRQPRDCQVSRDAILPQIGTAGNLREDATALTATITRPGAAAADLASAVHRMTARATFRFAAAATDRMDWRSLAESRLLDAPATPVDQARISLASFRFETVSEPAAATPQPQPQPETGATLVMDSQTWATINRVNTKVNRDIIRKTDIDNYGVEEFWSTPLEDGTKFGDCEDYVLEKRCALIAEGFPPSALSIAVVTTSWNATHAVLLVAGDKGEYVLDNLSPWVVPWNEAPYTFRKRQVAGDAFHWATVTPSASSLKYAGLNLIAL